MGADPKPGWTRYWCFRCKRPLMNDPTVKARLDTVSPSPPNGPEAGRRGFSHDHCGGEVALSSREVAA